MPCTLVHFSIIGRQCFTKLGLHIVTVVTMKLLQYTAACHKIQDEEITSKWMTAASP